MNIVQVGAYPPPFGGVTVHIARLHERLRKSGRESTVLDLSAEPADAPGVIAVDRAGAMAYLDDLPRSIVHFHEFSPYHAGDYARLAERHVTVLSLHNERFGDELASLGAIRRRIVRSRLRRLHWVVTDSEACARTARDWWGEAARIRTIPEFIPPTEVPPLRHEGLLELRRRCRYLLASNAWRVRFHRGEDLYGIDLQVRLLRELVLGRGLDVGIALMIPGGDDPYLDGLRERLRTLELEDRFLIVDEPIPEASSLWRESDVVLRTTNTDGSSLTVLEALAQGVPVVASDCVERPQGTTLFRNRDAASLAAAVAAVLEDPVGHRPRVSVQDHFDALIELYESAARGSDG